MGAADQIKKGLTKNLANFTKQRKAEEKQSSAGRWRTSRMREVRGVYLTEAADEVMEESYLKASDGGRLPATARQIYYVARPLIEQRTDKPLDYAYSAKRCCRTTSTSMAAAGTWSTTTAVISQSRTSSG